MTVSGKVSCAGPLQGSPPPSLGRGFSSLLYRSLPACLPAFPPFPVPAQLSKQVVPQAPQARGQSGLFLHPPAGKGPRQCPPPPTGPSSHSPDRSRKPLVPGSSLFPESAALPAGRAGRAGRGDSPASSPPAGLRQGQSHRQPAALPRPEPARGLLAPHVAGAERAACKSCREERGEKESRLGLRRGGEERGVMHGAPWLFLTLQGWS